MKDLWDERYRNKTYVYGTKPNAFFKETIDTYQFKGKIIFPAEGEGRNAIYAAKRGMDVHAFDTSKEGKKKADRLAEKEGVSINYEVGELFDLDMANDTFDVVTLIYAHFTPELSSKYHQKLAQMIRANGFIILEGFSKGHFEYQKINPDVGGPRNIDMLFSKEQILKDFSGFEIIKLEDIEVELCEGQFHNGIGKVIRFIGRKPL